MLESNWVRVCELEERSLNVSHCCRGRTDSERRNNNDKDKNKRQWAKCSDITHVHRQAEPHVGRKQHWQFLSNVIFHFVLRIMRHCWKKLASPTFLLTSEAAWEPSQAGYVDFFFFLMMPILIPWFQYWFQNDTLCIVYLQLHPWHKFSILALYWSNLMKLSHTFHFSSDPNFLSKVKKKTCVQELLVSASTM